MGFICKLIDVMFGDGVFFFYWQVQVDLFEDDFILVGLLFLGIYYIRIVVFIQYYFIFSFQLQFKNDGFKGF